MYKGRCVNRVTVFEFLVYPVNNVRPPLLYVISLCRYNKYNFINIWTPFWSERGLGVVSLSSHRNNKPDEALWPKRAFIIDIRPCKGDFCCRELLLLCGLYLFKQLAVGSCDLSQAQKKVTVVKTEQIHKMTIIFTQKLVKSCHFEWKYLSFLEFPQLITTVFFLSLR